MDSLFELHTCPAFSDAVEFANGRGLRLVVMESAPRPPFITRALASASIVGKELEWTIYIVDEQDIENTRETIPESHPLFLMSSDHMNVERELERGTA